MKSKPSKETRPRGLTKEILIDLIKDFGAAKSSYRDAKMFGRTRRIQTHKYYRTALYRLRTHGYVEKGRSGPQLTPEGRKMAELLLLSTPLVPEHKNWDGQWRLIAFDIPEIYRKERSLLRTFLLQSGFRKLQGSVWISPHDTLKEATRLWQELKLTPYVRSLLVSWIDNERALKQRFGLR